MINFSHITKIYHTRKNDVRALSDVSLRLPNKGFVALTGENGCGKTTLLNLVSTLDSDFEGDIRIDDLDVRRDQTLIRHKVLSYVFQKDCFIENLTVQDNLRIESDDESFISEQLDTFGILNKTAQFPRELSGGQSQRTSFIRGLLKDYEILLVDEPTSSMDEEMETYVFRTLKEISKFKLVVLVSHNMSMVHAYCDIIVKLNNGSIEFVQKNSSVEDILYENNEIIFVNELNFKSVDTARAVRMMDEYGSITVKKVQSQRDANEEEAYTPQKHSRQTQDKPISKRQQSLLTRSSLLSSKKSIIAGVLILSFLMIFLEIFFDLRSFDSNQYIYDTLMANGETFVSISRMPYLHINEVGYDMEAARWTAEDTAYIRDTYGIRVDSIVSWDQYTGTYLQVTDTWEEGVFYKPCIYGYSHSNIPESDLLAGHTPTSYCEYLISDYFADSLIHTREEYTSYEDLLTGGVEMNGYILDVCGIIDTDYEKYRDIPEGEWTQKDFDNYQNASMNVYSVVYAAAYLEETEKIGLQYVVNGDFQTDVVLDSSMDEKSGKCKANSAFAEVFDGECGDVCKTAFGYLEVSEFIDDGNPNPTVYVGKMAFQSAIRDADQYASYINLDISNREVFDYVMTKDMWINTHTGTYVYTVIDIVNVLDYFFAGLIMIMVVIIVVYSISLLKRIMNGNRVLFVFQKMYGFKKLHFLKAEYCTVCAVAVGSMIVNLLLYYVAYWGINKIISGLFYTSVVLLMNAFGTYCLVSLSMVVVVSVLYLALYASRERKNLIRLLEKS